MTETSITNLEKIEELYLHVIKLNKEKEELRASFALQKASTALQVEELQVELEALKTIVVELTKK